MMSNLEMQENELLSLQSIFDNKEFSVDGSNPPSGRIVAEVRLPEGFRVTAVKRKQLHAREVFEVSHLPPITLFFEFPASYPLETFPEFFLSCSWLSLQQLSALCRQLEYLWETNVDAILFTWMQFLQDEVLDFLGIGQCLDVSELLMFNMSDNFRHRENTLDDCASGTDALTLSAQCTNGVSVSGCKTIDLRAFNELSDGKMIIQILEDYNESRKQSIFYSTIQDCGVCFLQKPGSEFIKFHNCRHYFCKDCVKEDFEELIKDGSVNSLECLNRGCNTHLDELTIKSLVTSDLYERYERLLLSNTLDGMSDVVYCPRRDCQCPCIVDTCGHMASCSACDFVFCPLCKMTYHGIEKCSLKSEQWKRINEEYMAGDSSDREAIEKRYGKKVIRTIIQDALSENWKKSNSKDCPRCEVSIEKSEGCNKMTCFRCGVYFCWRCMRVLEKGNPYFHYNDTSSKCYNLLYPEDELEIEAY